MGTYFALAAGIAPLRLVEYARENFILVTVLFCGETNLTLSSAKAARDDWPAGLIVQIGFGGRRDSIDRLH